MCPEKPKYHGDFIPTIVHIRRRQWHPTPVLLLEKSHGWRSRVGCSLWGREESDTTEWHHFHFSLSCVGEGNGNPLQCSCLENPGDGGAWWAAVYGVAQSRTRLQQLSSSSSSSISFWWCLFWESFSSIPTFEKDISEVLFSFHLSVFFTVLDWFTCIISIHNSSCLWYVENKI